MCSKEIATLAGGCFWCLEAVFNDLKGVDSVRSGFSGGHIANPTYRQVCSETTGHAEVVQLIFDTTVITYDEILKVFFSVHDPTTLNRQGNDVGTSYRSAIYYHNDSQKMAAEQVISDLTAKELWPNPIVTEVTRFDEFYPAEGYHNEYFVNNLDQPYCRIVVAPKVIKFRKQFLDLLKK